MERWHPDVGQLKDSGQDESTQNRPQKGARAPQDGHENGYDDPIEIESSSRMNVKYIVGVETPTEPSDESPNGKSEDLIF